jgi:hypothetical protein
MQRRISELFGKAPERPPAIGGWSSRNMQCE